MNDELSFINASFGDIINRIYLKEDKRKDTTNTKSASYLDQNSEINGKEKLLTKLLINGMHFHYVLSTFLSSVATSRQHLGMEFSYYSSYVMTELVVSTQTFYN